MEDRFQDPKHIKWAKAIKERDNYMCQICGTTDAYLNSHHLDSWDFFIEKRFDQLNGICLCHACHERFHKIYGHGMNTQYQFREYEELMKVIIKIAESQES